MKTQRNMFEQMRSEILRQRYFWKDENGNIIETEDDMYHRVAHAVAAVESRYGASNSDVNSWASTFYQMLQAGKFLPNSPTLMNAGRPEGLLSACFVLPIEDSIEGIFETIKYTALIQKAGGGTGFSFDRLRPTGDHVASTGGKTSGPIGFWRVLGETTYAVQQGAFRRGANMAMMSVTHPDILKFLNAKQDPEAFTNFNISVKITHDWMRQLDAHPHTAVIVVNPRNNQRFYLPRSLDIGKYDIGDLASVPKESGNETALQESGDFWNHQQIWDLMIANAHQTGEPGVCFIDRVNQDNPTPESGCIGATNPCGEQPLLDYEACNLGSINLAPFVLPDAGDMDWNELASTVDLAVRFLDDVIDANYYPVPAIREMARGNRKIGLGVMGFADALIMRGIRYDSDQAVACARQISGFIQQHARQASEKLADERGSFPNWPGSIWHTKYQKPMCNAAVTTIAPTGTISLIAGCSSGIEPLFSIITKRRALDGQEFMQLHPLVERMGTQQGWLTDEVREQLSQGIPPKDIRQIPQAIADVMVTAHEIAPEWHVRLQAAFQKHVDNAVSKTVNLPSDATVADVDKIYRLAHQLGCKGTTVYRDGCRQHQVLTSVHSSDTADDLAILPRPRPRTTVGQTTKFRMGCGTLFVCVNKDEHGLAEVFANLGKAGGCAAQTEATCRAISISLRSGVDPQVLVEQLKNIRCLSTVTRRKEDKDIDVLSCPDAIAKAIEEAWDHSVASLNATERAVGRACPFCRQPMRRDSGCFVCDRCLFSSCG